MLTVVLCGGKGTRLGYDGQKCMAPVAGRPFIEHKIDNLLAFGHTDLFFLTGWNGDELEEVLHRRGYPYRRDVSLGRSLALHQARDCLPEWFWLTYGDTLLSYPREHVETVHKKTGRPVMTVNKDGVDYGAMIVPRDAFSQMATFGQVMRAIDPVPFPVFVDWHHINTPEDLLETEAWLCASA